MTTGDRRTDDEARVRAAIDQLLSGEIPDGLKVDVKSLCILAGVPRATFYRTYPHLKTEFDQRRSTVQENEREQDTQSSRIDRLTIEITELRARLSDRDQKINELTTFRATALSRLAAQHEEITGLRTALRSADHAKIRLLPNR